MHDTQLKVSIFSGDELQGFAELSASEYPDTSLVDTDFINWKHNSSPAGISTYLQLRSGELQIGRILVQPRTLLTSERTYRAGCLADLLIMSGARKTPNHFLRLNSACNSLIGFDFLYHTSNDRSFPLYSKLLRYKYPAVLKGYGVPISIGRILETHIGKSFVRLEFLSKIGYSILEKLLKIFIKITNITLDEGLMSDSEMTNLLKHGVLGGDIVFDRTPSYLKWRSLENPVHPCKIFRIYQQKKFIGYFILGNITLNKITHSVLHDFFLRPKLSFMMKITLRIWLIMQSYKEKAETFFTMANDFSGQTKQLLGFPFFRIPDKFLPHFTPIFIRILNDKSSIGIMKSAHITLSDLDYF